MDEEQFILHLKGLNLEQNILKYEKKIKNGMADLINMTNQIKIENFLSGDLSDTLAVDYIDIINSIKRVPSKIYSHFTGMNSGIILDWILSILQNPEAFARIVVKYFRNDNKNLSYFSAITFPSLFNHFFTEDFQKLSYQFLMSMLESGDIGTFWYFCLSFIESSSNFSVVLWSNFLNLTEYQEIFFVCNRYSQENSDQDQSNFQPKIQSSQVFFRFLKCLEIASSALSIYQQMVLKKFSEANATTCSFFLCKYFIERSFFWFRGNEPDQKDLSTSEFRFSSLSSSDRSGVNPFFNACSESFQNDSDSTCNETFSQNNLPNGKNLIYIRKLNEEIIKILEYAALNPKSPQFTTIVNVLTSSKFSRFVPNIVSSHTYFILSQRDCYLIQEIIKKNAKDKEEENQEEQKESDDQKKINFVKVFPLTEDSFNNFAPMSIEIPLANFSKLWSKQKSLNTPLKNFKNDELILFPYKNEKMQKLLDLVMFDHFIDNEFSKRNFEQARSHFCFASKLLQKNQFVKRKMIDFNSFYGYFQSHNYKNKRHTHSNENALSKSKGITSYKSYYIQKTNNLFDLSKITPLSPDPPKYSITYHAKSDNESSGSQSFEKRRSKRKVVFNNVDDQNNTLNIQPLSPQKESPRRKSLNIQKSFSGMNSRENFDFGLHNEEFVLIVETKPRKKKLASDIMNSYQIVSKSNPDFSANNLINENQKINENENENDEEQSDESEKLSKKQIKKMEKKRKKKEKKEKKRNKKEKSKEEKKNKEKNKEEDKEEKKEEKILLKESEKKSKKEKKEIMKQKKEEEKMKKIRVKKEKRREKMRKNQEKKLRKNSDILDHDYDGNHDNFDTESTRTQTENKSESDYNSSKVSENNDCLLCYDPKKNSSECYNDDNDNDSENDDEPKIENNFELRKPKKSKKKRKHHKSEISAYFSSSILLNSSANELHPILDDLIPQIENNESKLILYCIKLNDFEFKSKIVDRITSEYVSLFNSQRLRKIKKYLTCHRNWFRAANLLASKIDFMSDFNIGTAIIIFCQICKYFSPLSTYSQTVLNVIPESPSSSNIIMQKSKNQNSSQNSEEETEYNEEKNLKENEVGISIDDFILNHDTDTSLDIYSYKNDYYYDDDSNYSENSNSNSDSKSKKNKVYPPSLITKDVVNFLRFVLMLSHTDCFIRYFTWITKVLVVFPQIKNIVCEIYGVDVSHLEIAFKTLISKIDEPLLVEIGKEVFKKYEKGEN